MAKEEIKEKLKNAIIEGDEEVAEEVAKEAIETGMDAMEAIDAAAEGLQVLGDKFERMEVYLPELILSGDAMKICMDILLPHVEEEKEGAAKPAKVVIGTVSGDVHDVGKTLVGAMLSVSGFEVHDLGSDVPAKKFVEKAAEINATAIALSALMSTSAYYQEEIIRYLRDAGLREKYYIVVGGGPVTPQWAEQIGADGHGRLATDVPKLLKQIIADGNPPPLAKPLVTGY